MNAEKPRGRRSPVWISGGLAIVLLAAGGYLALSKRMSHPHGGGRRASTIAANTYPGAAPVFIALRKGYFRDEGLEVTLHVTTTGQAALDEVLAGKADLCTVADIPFMLAVMKGADISLVTTLFTGGRDHGMIARTHRGISHPRDLKGKRIGVTVGTSGHFLLDTVLISHQLSPADVTLVNLRPEGFSAALSGGDIDAVATWDPYLSALQKELGEQGVVFHGGPIFTLAFNMAGSRQFLASDSEAVRKVLRGLIRAVAFIHDTPDESRKIMAEVIKVDPRLLGETWNPANFGIGLDQSLLATLEDQARWAVKTRLVEARAVPNFLNNLHTDGLRAVQPEAVRIIQ